MLTAAGSISIQHVSPDGSVTVMKEGIAVEVSSALRGQSRHTSGSPPVGCQIISSFLRPLLLHAARRRLLLMICATAVGSGC
jgi:hypothetical protein